MRDPAEGIWNDAGFSTLRWLLAEALAAYQVWERLSPDFWIEWKNAKGWDLRITTSGGKQTLINAKRCWAHTATDLAFGGPVNPSDTIHYIALVQLEDVDISWSRDSNGRVHLNAAADPVQIFYLPNHVIRAEARWDGASTSRAVIPLSIASNHQVVPSFE